MRRSVARELLYASGSDVRGSDKRVPGSAILHSRAARFARSGRYRTGVSRRVCADPTPPSPTRSTSESESGRHRRGRRDGFVGPRRGSAITRSRAGSLRRGRQQVGTDGRLVVRRPARNGELLHPQLCPLAEQAARPHARLVDEARRGGRTDARVEVEAVGVREPHEPAAAGTRTVEEVQACPCRSRAGSARRAAPCRRGR